MSSLRVPAEWAPQKAMWIGWPSHADLWAEDLEPARAEVGALARAVAGPGGVPVRLLCGSDEGLSSARTILAAEADITVVPGRFGDIWLRDTGPIFCLGEDGPVASAFRFNGWGGKYDLPHDDEVAARIADHAGAPLRQNDFIMEGGALDHDGRGTILTTEQCLLNPNRNAGWTRARAEAALQQSLGARRVIWLGDGLVNDHTDGHVDNLARFVGENLVACPVASGDDDPNADIYEAAARDIAAAGLGVVRIPSPGRVEDEDGEIVPASHMNFLIVNGAVIVPTYGNESAARAACQALAMVFGDRQIIPLPSSAILTGGGSFHCISQQEPLA